MTFMKRFSCSLFALLSISLAASAANFPYATFNQQTNRLSDNGTALTYNGVPLPTSTNYVSTTNTSPQTMAGALELPTMTLTNGSAYASLFPDAANTLALRNGANAQAFNVYNKDDGAGNYERLTAKTTGGTSWLITEHGGTGSAEDLVVGTSGASSLVIMTGNANRWQVSGTTGHFLASSDNTYDIGASGANRPRNVYVGNAVTAGSFDIPLLSIGDVNTNLVVDFSTLGFRTANITNDTWISVQNMPSTVARTIEYVLYTGDTNRNVIWQTGLSNSMGAPLPAVLPSNNVVNLTLRSIGTTVTNVHAYVSWRIP